jgi:hypothetical protein
MARMKIDGVIEAVRYSSDGGIHMVRAYQRRGAVWSDLILLDRSELVEQLQKGKHFVTGTRKKSLGSVFETGPAVGWVNQHIVTTDQSAQHDLLAGCSIF